MVDVELSRAEGTVELAPGLTGPATIELWRKVGDPSVDVSISAAWEDGAYRIRRVEAVGADVPRDILERLPVRALVAQVVLDSIEHGAASQDSPTQAAASVYRVGLAVGEAPTQLVAERLGISRATAARRIAEARSQGLLSADEQAPQGGAAARRSTKLD